jgi:hypothetical protein
VVTDHLPSRPWLDETVPPDVVAKAVDALHARFGADDTEHWRKLARVVLSAVYADLMTCPRRPPAAGKWHCPKEQR